MIVTPAGVSPAPPRPISRFTRAANSRPLMTVFLAFRVSRYRSIASFQTPGSLRASAMRVLMAKVLLPFGCPQSYHSRQGRRAGRAPRRRTCFAVLSHHRTFQLIGSPPVCWRLDSFQFRRSEPRPRRSPGIGAASLVGPFPPGPPFFGAIPSGPAGQTACREVPQWPCKMAYGQHQRGQLPRAALLFAGSALNSDSR
jgi:hypothetical protein